MIYIPVATAFVIALCLGFLSIPVAKRMAHRFGLVDKPDQKRKLHKDATPLIGGITIFIGVIVTLLIVSLTYSEHITFEAPASAKIAKSIADGAESPSRENVDQDAQKAVDENEATSSTESEDSSQQVLAGAVQNKKYVDINRLTGLLIASLLILVIGVIDDRYMIRGRQKLLGQIVAATILIVFNFRFDTISVAGQTINLQIFSIIVVYGWILIGINSVNLLDGADGFASTIGLLMSVALCVMACQLGRYDDAVICAAMAGALLAFMRFNFPPASAYLGDAGSMLIGLFIAAMAIKCTSKEAATYAFFAPIALLAIPMFDTLAAIVRRRLTGRSIYAVDRGHLHHELMRKGFSPRKALMLFFAMCLMTATGGTMSVIHENSGYAILSIIAVIVFLIVSRVFGFAEFQLLSNRSKSMMRSFFTMPKVKRNSHHASVRLQGERNWDLCWQVLREFAEKNKLSRITMDLNLPWIHESFHANYSGNDRKVATGEQWSVELPLVVRGTIIGRIDIRSNVNETAFSEVMAELNDILLSLESYFIETMECSLAKPDVDASVAERQSLEFAPRPPESQALDVG